MGGRPPPFGNQTLTVQVNSVNRRGLDLSLSSRTSGKP
jgi:hypothetical protein